MKMALHIRTCAAAGINESRAVNAIEAPANVAYTRYVLDAGMQGDFLDLMAALLPCVMAMPRSGSGWHRRAAPTPLCRVGSIPMPTPSIRECARQSARWSIKRLRGGSAILNRHPVAIRCKNAWTTPRG